VIGRRIKPSADNSPSPSAVTIQMKVIFSWGNGG